MLRKLAISLGAAACALLFFSCQPSDPEVPQEGGISGISVDKTALEVPEEGLVESVTVSAPEGVDITTRVESVAKKWIAVEAKGDGVYELNVAANETTKARSAKVFFSAEGYASATVKVSQDAAKGEKHFNISATSFSMENTGGNITVEIDAYPAPKIEISGGDGWLTGPKVAGKLYRFTAEQWNTDAKEEVRTATILVTSGKESKTVTVAQSSSSYVRRSLVTKFTGSWCGYCPFMSFLIEEVIESVGDALVPMYVYNSSGNLTTDCETKMLKTFGYDGYPTGMVDYRVLFPNGTSASTVKALLDESASELPAGTGFDASVSVSGGNLQVDVTVHSVVNDPDLKLVVSVLEDGIISKQSFYGTASDYPQIDFNKYVNDHVAHTFPTTYLGESVPVEAGKTVKKSYSVNINSKWVADNLSAVIYTLRPLPTEDPRGVKGVKYITKAGCYVDNVVSVPVGRTVKVEYR